MNNIESSEKRMNGKTHVHKMDQSTWENQFQSSQKSKVSMNLTIE